MTDELKKIYEDLSISEDHLLNYKLTQCKESPLSDLEVVDIDFEGKPFILEKSAALAWRKMRAMAAAESVVLEPFSGFRSYLYQKQLIKRKLNNGKTLDTILTETAIPGFSEHHTGRAVDICTDGIFNLSESFENTEAFKWLSENASRFKFKLSYPRNNDMEIVYEPWHWFYIG